MYGPLDTEPSRSRVIRNGHQSKLTYFLEVRDLGVLAIEVDPCVQPESLEGCRLLQTIVEVRKAGPLDEAQG